MRLDHFLLSPNLSVRLVDGGVDRWRVGTKTRATISRGFSQRFCVTAPSSVKGGPFPSAYAFCLFAFAI